MQFHGRLDDALSRFRLLFRTSFEGVGPAHVFIIHR